MYTATTAADAHNSLPLIDDRVYTVRKRYTEESFTLFTLWGTSGIIRFLKRILAGCVRNYNMMSVKRLSCTLITASTNQHKWFRSRVLISRVQTSTLGVYLSGVHVSHKPVQLVERWCTLHSLQSSTIQASVTLKLSKRLHKRVLVIQQLFLHCSYIISHHK